MIDFINRLEKMARHYRKWARRRGIEAFRVYDQDIPQYPFAVDIYRDHAVVYEYEKPHITGKPDYFSWKEGLLNQISLILDIPAERIHNKTRKRQKGDSQYEKISETGETIEIVEGGLIFRVNLNDYLDTGLFLDHRKTREIVETHSSGKKVLNLFCYTGSFSVYAASGGAKSVTSLDLSPRYLDWAEQNMRRNNFTGERFRYVQGDAREFLENDGGDYDLVVCDPPVFSRGKKLTRDFDVLRDSVDLIDSILDHLSEDGELYYSTNYRNFSLRVAQLPRARVEDITNRTIPEDFRNRKIHTCYRITHKD